MNAPPEIRQLVERFQLHRDAYRSAQYNETQVRREFVDPFFKALGWDVDNEQGYAEAYKDVIHEDALKFGGSTKAPDYCFRIGGVRKYFVETKRPSINLKEDPEPAYQLRRYAWSAKLPLSVLTDFEEFCVYNCRVRPQKTDKASKERVLYITWDEYLDRWDEIAGIFSRDAILRGAFDKYAASKKKRGTAEVDEAFLKEIEGWREVLARNLALRNPGLSQRELNYAVQKTIDRIIFLRICEDRGIEPADRLRAVTNGPHLYGRLCQLFRAADDRYNSGLFHFQREKGRPEDPDEWTLDLAIDDKPLKDIITGLYYPDSPYEFSVLPADILGQVYEQFLGKVIRLTKGHQARVEEKPEVRKAGGVYYTPTYIVDYIVANTVGKLLEGKTAFDVAARTKAWRPAKQGRPLTVLDPACGSGSFLIGAYQYLLDWYRDWYAANDPHHWLRLKEPTICETVTSLPSPPGSEPSLPSPPGSEPSLPSPPGSEPSLPSPSGRGAGGEGFSGEGFSGEGFSGEGFSSKGFSSEGFSDDGFPHVGLAPTLAPPTTKPPLPPDLLEFARQLRRRQTEAEALMWALLRNRRLGGLKFRRQHPLPPYILDFYCHEAKLAIELDGGQHNSPDERARDQRRSAFIQEQGIRVLRFWNHDVLGDTETVLEAIWNALPQKTLTPNPSPGGRGEPNLPSPSKREPNLPSPSGRDPNLPSPSGREPNLPSPSGREPNLPSPSGREPNLPSLSGRGAGAEGLPQQGFTSEPIPTFRLTTSEKKRILLDHIFGVDIDAQAVEVTKLSLLLKVLEGETRETLQRQLFARERALPDLGNNIKCGNSLIGPDFYDGRQLDMFDEEERYRINAFDWQREFPHIFASSDAAEFSGFDGVIGNPPYVRMEEFKSIKQYLREHYACHDERSDLYAYFMEREHQLLREGGVFGKIVSNKFIRANYGRPLRKTLAEVAHVDRIVDLAGLPVFRGATVRTIVLLTTKGHTQEATWYSPPPPKNDFLTVETGSNSLSELVEPIEYPVLATAFNEEGWSLIRPEHAALTDRLKQSGTSLKDYMDGRICMGIKSGLTQAFVISGNQRRTILDQNPEADEIIHPFLQGRNIRCYRVEPDDQFLIYTHHGIDMTPYPAVLEHLRPFRKRLENRATKQNWYELQQPQFAYFDFFKAPKIVFPDIATTCRFALDAGGHFGANTVYFLPTDDLALLGVLNSRVAFFFFQQICAALEGPGEAYLRFFGQYLEAFPVPLSSASKPQRTRLTDLVDHILTLHRQLQNARTGHEQTALRRQIESTDAEIDRLVYNLYGLSDDEMRLVEGGTS